MSQSGGFDMSKMSSAEKIVAGAALGYFIWIFLPVWYTAVRPSVSLRTVEALTASEEC